MHYTGDTEAKLRLSIINAVTANNLIPASSYASLAFEDACTHLRAELGQRQAEDRERSWASRPSRRHRELFAAAMRPKSKGSSTIGMKKSTV